MGGDGHGGVVHAGVHLHVAHECACMCVHAQSRFRSRQACDSSAKFVFLMFLMHLRSITGNPTNSLVCWLVGGDAGGILFGREGPPGMCATA